MSVPFPNVRILGPRKYELVSDFIYEWDHNGERYRMTIPEEFQCDLASVPRIIWPLISPIDLAAASIPHDWLYAYRGVLPYWSYEMRVTDKYWVPVEHVWTRREADRLFGRMMRESHVPRWMRRAAFRAVRLFGRCAWQR